MSKTVLIRMRDIVIKLENGTKEIDGKTNAEIIDAVKLIIQGGKSEKDMVPLSDLKTLFNKAQYFFKGKENDVRIEKDPEGYDIFIYPTSEILFFEVYD